MPPPSVDCARGETDPVVGSGRALLVVATVAAVAYGLAFIYQTRVVLEGRTYYVLFDDAMITLRYARNWASGAGPVWNPGERVEGYTSFGWMALIALLQKLPLSAPLQPLLIQLLGLGIVALTMWACPVVAVRAGLHPTSGALAGATLGLCYPFLYWTLTGMEMGALGLLLLLAAGLLARESASAHPPWLAAGLLAVAALFRPEALAVAAALAICLLFAPPAKDRHARLVAAGTVIVLPLVVFALYRGWALFYYGDLLPNTYRLKMDVPLLPRVVNGVRYSVHSLGRLSPLLLGLSLLAIPAFFPKQSYRLLLAPFVSLCLFQIWAGGDAWPDDRFVWPGMAGVLLVVYDGAVELWRSRSGSLPRRPPGWLAAGLLLFVVVWQENVPYVGLWSRAETWYQANSRENVAAALAIERTTTPDARVTATWAGTTPYLHRRYTIDLFGKSDRTIASLPPRGRLQPGHDKLDFDYSIATLKPDVVDSLTVVESRDPGYLPRLRAEYLRGQVEVGGERISMWFRKGSPRVKWDQVQVEGVATY